MNEPLTPEQAAAQTFFESCPFKAISSGVVGFGMGGLFGMFMGSIDFTSSSELVSRPLREQVVKGYKEMFQRAFSSAKGFGMVASIYSGTECLIES
ncbi:Mitochondrial import inner membrane translocase subunit tim22, partial [Coelomomyces lativittatus]